MFVQALKVSTVDKLGNYVAQQPYDAQRGRMTHDSQDQFFDGWAIDTVPDAVQPYYGMNDDGTFPFDPVTPNLYSATPGSSFQTATLRDSPVSTDWDKYSIQAISVAVCIDGESLCDHRTLGYYYWFWSVPDSHKSDYANFEHGVTGDRTTYVKAFDLAVQAWNNNLDGKRVAIQLRAAPAPVPPQALNTVDK